MLIFLGLVTAAGFAAILAGAATARTGRAGAGLLVATGRFGMLLATCLDADSAKFAPAAPILKTLTTSTIRPAC